MQDNACLLGGMLALSSLAFRQKDQKLNITVENTRAKTYLELAVNITDTCHHVANRTRTKLLPAEFLFNKITNNKTYIT